MIFVVSNLGPFSVSVFFSGKNLPTKIPLRKHSNDKMLFFRLNDEKNVGRLRNNYFVGGQKMTLRMG